MEFSSFSSKNKLKTEGLQKKPRSIGASHSADKNRLGRGLDVLLGSEKENPFKTDSFKAGQQILFLDIEKISPGKSQPRTAFDKKSLEELSFSIKKNGILQPILVEKKEDGYQILAGERRWRAAGLAGLRQVPAILKSPKPHQAKLWALIENIQREDLSPIEEARAFQKIMRESRFTQEDLAKSLGRSRPSVANSLRLLQLDKEVQKLLEGKQISFAQARELLRFKSPLVQRKMAKKCLKGLTVRKLSSKPEASAPPPFWAKQALSHLQREFSQKPKLKYCKGRGSLSLSFKNDTELKNILNRLWK